MDQDTRKSELLDAILPHVAFDGWSPAAFKAASADIGMTAAEATALCPRGAVDLAMAYHARGDAAMVAAIRSADLTAMKFRDRVAFAIKARIAAIDDKEAVRRGSALFALPHMAADGARLIWGTADLIWQSLGDTSRDVNWYTKRATLSGVYGAVVLYWLGDDSFNGQATDEFIARRIDNVMQVEKLKAQVNGNRMLKPVLAPLNQILGKIRAPRSAPPSDLPGSWTAPR